MKRGLSTLENVCWCEMSWRCSVLCLLPELNPHWPLPGTHSNFNFGECWTISCHTRWARVERPYQTCFNKSSLTAPKSLAKAKVSSLSQREDNLSDHQARVLTHTSGQNATAGHSSRVKIPTVTFPSDTCPSEGLFNNMEGNQVGQGHNILCAVVRKHSDRVVSVFFSFQGCFSVKI